MNVCSCGSMLTHVHPCDACHILHVNCTGCSAVYLVMEDGTLLLAPKVIKETVEEPVVRLVEEDVTPDKFIGSNDIGQAKEKKG